jgi:peroxiredoxin (alkyl hydroperoxide reductase subunit C)
VSTEMVAVTVPRIPRIGEPAPDFESNSTQGVVRLSDFTSKGKWVVLFSHPGDFLPVCTTEFVEFARRNDDFEKRKAQLIGCSVDSVFSHIAWIRSIQEDSGIKIPFPVIADADRKVARLFGMLHDAASDTATVRAVLFIDPTQTIRTLLYYPVACGRNIDEILRIVDALQMSDTNHVATPANWRPGESVIVPPPTTQADAEERVAGRDGLEITDWYLARSNWRLPTKSAERLSYA